MYLRVQDGWLIHLPKRWFGRSLGFMGYLGHQTRASYSELRGNE